MGPPPQPDCVYALCWPPTGSRGGSSLPGAADARQPASQPAGASVMRDMSSWGPVYGRARTNRAAALVKQAGAHPRGLAAPEPKWVGRAGARGKLGWLAGGRTSARARWMAATAVASKRESISGSDFGRRVLDATIFGRSAGWQSCGFSAGARASRLADAALFCLCANFEFGRRV